MTSYKDYKLGDNMTNFGIDSSDYNGAINLTKPGAPSVSFGAARCGVGTVYKDVKGD